VGPETLNSYEIGYKQSFGKSLLVDLAAFYYDYIGFQLPISITNGGVTQAQFVNVPKAKSEGIEAEIYWSPVRDLTITGSYSYDNTAVLTGCSGAVAGGVLTPASGSLCLIDTNDPNAVSPQARPFPGQNPAAARDQSVKGDPLPDAPKNKVAVSVAYTWHYDPGDLTLSTAYVWRDKMVGTVFDRTYDSTPAWSDVDIRALWKGPNDRYEIIGYVKNIFNTEQYTVAAGGVGLLGNSFRVTNAAAGLVHDNLYNLNPPRTYGLEVRYKFF
jgi:iron complex outermembrane receptor protein